MFYDYFLADFGFMVYAPRLVFEYKARTEGFKELYELIFPQ